MDANSLRSVRVVAAVAVRGGDDDVAAVVVDKRNRCHRLRRCHLCNCAHRNADRVRAGRRRHFHVAAGCCSLVGVDGDFVVVVVVVVADDDDAADDGDDDFVANVAADDNGVVAVDSNADDGVVVAVVDDDNAPVVAGAVCFESLRCRRCHHHHHRRRRQLCHLTLEIRIETVDSDRVGTDDLPPIPPLPLPPPVKSLPVVTADHVIGEFRCCC